MVCSLAAVLCGCSGADRKKQVESQPRPSVQAPRPRTPRVDLYPGAGILSKPDWFRNEYPEAARTTAQTGTIRRSFHQRLDYEYQLYVDRKIDLYKAELAARNSGDPMRVDLTVRDGNAMP